VVDKDLIARLVGAAREQGVSMEGGDGLPARVDQAHFESALEGEITDHLGYEKHQRSGSSDAHEEARNARNGTRAKTIASKVGPVEIEIP
jgi:transposase-like protein